MGKRPDYATTVYCNLIRQTYKDVPILIGGIEASLRRLGHYDYWSDTMKRSIYWTVRPTCSCTAWGKRPSWRWPTP